MLVKPTSSPKTRPYGVFCLENWSARLTNRESVKPILELAEREAGVEFIHRQVSGRDDFLDYIKRWAGGYTKYKLGYFACHGQPGSIVLGNEELSIGELGKEFKDRRISCKGRILYFGSCATLGVSTRDLDRLLDDTQAAAICGYRHEDGVDWLESAAFELLLIGSLSSSARRGASFQLRDLKRDYSQLARDLHFTYRPVAPRRQ